MGCRLSIGTSDWMLVEALMQDSEVIYSNDDIVQNTKLEPQSPTSPKSPTGKSTKFQNNRVPASGKAEEGKKKQVLDYLGGLFSSIKKGSKNASPSSSHGNSVDECPPVTKDFSFSGESASVQGTPDSVISSFSHDSRREGVTQTKAADQHLAEIPEGSPEERSLLPAVGNPAQLAVSSTEENRSANKNVIVADVNLQSIHKEAENQTVFECVGGQLASKSADTNPATEFVTAFVGNVSNIFGSVVINKEDTSLSSACADASLPSADRSAKEYEIGELDTCCINENISQATIRTKGSEFVNSDRLAEGQYDCETIANCLDIPAVKECVLPISETVRIEQVAEVIEIDVHPPKIKENSNIALPEVPVSLPINNIGAKLNVLDDTVQLNHSVVQGFEKETENYNIAEKPLCESTLEKQQDSSTKDTFTPVTKKSQVAETGGVPHIGEGAANSHDSEQFTTGSLSGKIQNGVVGQESNTDKTATNSLINIVSSENTTVKSVDLFSGLKTDLNSATLESIEMDKKSPTESKRGKRKGRRRRSLKSGQPSDRDAEYADAKTNEEELKEIASNKKSPEVPVKTASSPKQSTPPLVPHQTLPKSFPSREKSVQDPSKPNTSRKNCAQQASCSPTSGNKRESPVKISLEKASRAETEFSGSETCPLTHSSTDQKSDQKVEKHTASGNSDTKFLVASNGAVDDSASKKNFILSLQSADTHEHSEETIALKSAEECSAIASVSQISNQQNTGSSIKYNLIEQESSADPGMLKTLESNNLEGESNSHHAITSQLCSTVTTKIRLPSAGKEDGPGALITSNQRAICTDTRTEEEETIRITLPRKKKATSHHKVDFYATKDLPLASTKNKMYIGSLKIQIHNKSAKQAKSPATEIGQELSSTPMHAKASGGVNEDVSHNTGEILKAICVDFAETKHISAEEHKNKEMNSTSAPVENTPLKTFLGAQTGRPEENSSLGIVSSVLHTKADVKNQSFPINMRVSGINSSEIDVPTKNVKVYKADIVATTSDLDLPVPLAGVGLQNREMKENTSLPLNVLIFETAESEIEKGAPTKDVNEQKAVQDDAKGEIPQLVQQNTPNVEHQDIKDTTLPQKVQASETEVSDVKDTNVNHAGNQKDRHSAAVVKIAQQSPPKPQPRVIKDVGSPESTEMSETMPEIKGEVPAKSDSKRPPDLGAGKAELAQESSPVLQINDSKAQSTFPQPIQSLKSTVSEMKKDTNANFISEQQECLGVIMAEGTLPVQLSSSKTQQRETKVKDTSPQGIDMSVTEKEAFTICSNVEKSGTDTLTSDVVLPFQKSTIDSACKEKEIQNTPSLSVKASKITMHEIKTDTTTDVVSDTELRPNEATVEFALPLKLNTTMLQNNNSEIKATILLGAEMNNKTSANSSNELNTLTSDDIIPPMQKEVVNLQYREVDVNDIPVCAVTSITVSKIRNGVTENGAGDTVTGSTAARGELALPAEQNVSTLENRGFEIIEAALPQSLETSRSTGSKINKGFSTTAAFEQKAGSENAMNNFGQPVLSSTPKMLHNESKLKRAVAASSVETPAGNLPRTEDSQTAGSTAKESELGAATNQFSLPVQNIKESQLRESIVKEASVVDDSWTTKAIVDPNVDLDSLTNVFVSFVPQTASKSEANGLNVSFNEGSSLDSSSDMESFTETIRKYGNPINRPQKKQRVPKVPFVPPFAMPPIQEDRTSPRKEKTFDPSSFRCGLMKNRYTNKAPLSLLKMQQTETKSKVVKRVSAEQSLLFKSLTNKSSRLRVSKQKNAENDPASASDSKRSRLEVDETLAQTSKPSTEPLIEPADLTPSLLRNDVVEEFKFDLSNLTFPETQLPRFMENNLEVNTSEMEDKSDNSEKQSENGVTIPDLKTNLSEINTDFRGITNTCALDSIPTFLGSGTADGNQNPLSLFNADLFTPNSVLPNLPEVGVPGTRELTLNSRPGKIVIYNQCNLCGEAIEVFHDVKDATPWKLGRDISIRVVRGCWLIYQKPNFEGDKIALEDDVLELSDIWGQEVAEDNCDDAHISSPKTSLIGSLRRIVKTWGLPEIELCTGLHGLKRKTAYVDDVEEIEAFGVLEPTLSLDVYSGAWLLFEEPFYQGNSYFVEPGQYPCPEHWGAMDPFIGSLRPLKMGTLKVETFKDNKVIVYEKPFFEGKQLELKTDVFSFVGGDEETVLCHTYPFANIGSLKVIGGFWVGYEKPGFQGHQYVLEEGEYQEWNDWGGYDEHLQSLRFIQVNLSSPVMIMYNEINFSEKSGNIEVLGPVPDLQDIDHGLRTESINVLSGTWVAYENTDFTGEQYVLEMGLYTSYEDWGATNSKISSIQPVLLDVMDSELSKFEVQFFSEPEFQGSANVFNTDTAQFLAGFSPKSCKVQSGSWVAYDAENFTGNQYILEEESYSDLMMIGCANDVHIKSVKTVGFYFSIPVIILFQREKFEGKKIELVSEVRKLALKGYNNHIFSVQVIGGIWVAYECSNYRGRQILLQPCQIANWHQHTGWHRIGSLRPLIQSRVYFRVRNRGTGTFMTFVGELNEINMVRVQAVEGTGMDDQIWFYQDGLIKTKMAEDCCLDVVGSFFGQNSRLGISVDNSEAIQSWNISSDGVILNGIRTDLVIDIKGGQQYDQSQTILNIFDELQPTQRWDLEIL
ncbi:uncharacterized protein [Scyliorhinus torazame]|uniref:uncharacterized protein isoform X2 n=1 Tax=Scyliorhinus torazame TaxID=75743 RepID=UPI003B5C5B00